jgi:type VI secretion system protein ImpH
LRLGQVPEMDFAPAALSSFVRPAQGSPRLGVRFFGLLGPQGPMPLHVTEYVRERLRQHGDPTLTHFLDLFHHRLLTLFYNAWAQAQPTVHFDRPADDRYTAWLGSSSRPAAGGQRRAQRDIPGPSSRPAVHPRRHPEALCKVLRQFFGVGVSLRTHVGQWLDIQGADRSRLGHAAIASSAPPHLARRWASAPTRAARSGTVSTASACTWAR